MEDLISAARADQGDVLQRRRQEWEAHRATPAYIEASSDLAAVSDQFIQTLQVCWFAATRTPQYVDRSVMLRSIDDMLECAVIQHTAVERTARNTARRELRYLLELAVKALFVDQRMPTSSFEHRLTFFESKVKTHGLTPELDQLQLDMFDESAKKAFVRDIGLAYGLASKYVHPSVKQITERVQAAASGVSIGFDSADLVASVAKQNFDVYGMVLVLVLHSLGVTTAGEVMEAGFGADENWLFHRHRHVARLDEYFDYKTERTARLPLLRAWRARSFPR